MELTIEFIRVGVGSVLVKCLGGVRQRVLARVGVATGDPQDQPYPWPSVDLPWQEWLSRLAKAPCLSFGVPTRPCQGLQVARQDSERPKGPAMAGADLPRREAGAAEPGGAHLRDALGGVLLRGALLRAGLRRRRTQALVDARGAAASGRECASAEGQRGAAAEGRWPGESRPVAARRPGVSKVNGSRAGVWFVTHAPLSEPTQRRGDYKATSHSGSCVCGGYEANLQ